MMALFTTGAKAMNLAHQSQSPTSLSKALSAGAERAANAGHSPVIDFATASAPKLADLLDAFTAAERELGLACTEDDKFPGNRQRVEVLGGIVAASTLIIDDGRPPARFEASEWFYHSRDDIERDYTNRILDVKTQEEFDVVEQRFTDLRTECDRQQQAIDRAIPRGKRAAERRLERAHRAVSAAEQKILRYKPTCLSEAATLLEYVSGGKRRNCFSTNENDLHTIMLNVASVIQKEIAS
jgi:hypothetical protein